jgi:hypothetical protein
MNLKNFFSLKNGIEYFKKSNPNKIEISKTNGNAVVNLILYAKHPMMHVKAIIRYLRIPEISLIFKNK